MELNEVFLKEIRRKTNIYKSICSEKIMLEENLKNLSQTMGYVIRNWDKIINPALQSGETEGLAGIILDSYMRAEIIKEKMGISIYKNNGSPDFKTAIWILNSLRELLTTNKDSRALEYLRLSASRYFNQMDIALSQDEIYKSAKRGL